MPIRLEPETPPTTPERQPASRSFAGRLLPPSGRTLAAGIHRTTKTRAAHCPEICGRGSLRHKPNRPQKPIRDQSPVSPEGPLAGLGPGKTASRRFPRQPQSLERQLSHCVILSKPRSEAGPCPGIEPGCGAGEGITRHRNPRLQTHGLACHPCHGLSGRSAGALSPIPQPDALASYCL